MVSGGFMMTVEMPFGRIWYKKMGSLWSSARSAMQRRVVRMVNDCAFDFDIEALHTIVSLRMMRRR